MAENYFTTYSGGEIKIFFGKQQLAAVQSVSWKASQSKKPVRGAGHAKAHGMSRALAVEYTLDLEVAEWNGAIITDPPAQARTGNETVSSFVFEGVVYRSLLELKNCTIMLLYPPKNGVQRVVKFTGFEFTDDGGDFSVDAEMSSRKLSGTATDAEGLV